jgi:hypothetical protein
MVFLRVCYLIFVWDGGGLILWTNVGLMGHEHVVDLAFCATKKPFIVRGCSSTFSAIAFFTEPRP